MAVTVLKVQTEPKVRREKLVPRGPKAYRASRGNRACPEFRENQGLTVKLDPRAYPAPMVPTVPKAKRDLLEPKASKVNPAKTVSRVPRAQPGLRDSRENPVAWKQVTKVS
jgi:hypothetical protein